MPSSWAALRRGAASHLSFSRLHLRWGLQVAAAVLAVMAVFSTPTIYNTFSLKSSSTVNPQLIVIYTCLVLLARHMASKPAALLFGQIGLAAVLGAGLAVGVQEITRAANGGDWSTNTVTKAAVLLALSVPVVCCLTVLRFRSPPFRLPMLFATLVFALSVCGSYRAPSASMLWQFPLYIAMYVGFAGCFATLASLFVTPTPSGMMARLSLATALRGSGELLWAAADLASGPVGANGKLAAATGKRQGGIDSGLIDTIMPLHKKSSAAGVACQAALTHTAAARWEVDVYRAGTHLLPYVAFMQTGVLARSLLREQVMAAAGCFRACCNALAACLEANRPISEALQALDQLHASFLKLGEAAGSLPAELHMQPGALAMSTVLSLLFSAVARLRKLYRVLPSALARDQPGSAAEAAACFARLPQWDISTLVELERKANERDALSMLRDSLLSVGGSAPASGAPSPRSHSGALEALLEQAGSQLPDEQKEQLLARLSMRSISRATQQAQHGTGPKRQQKQQAGWRSLPGRALRVCRRLAERAWAAVPVTRMQLQLAVQLAVCFIAVMFLEISASSYVGLEGRPVWAMTIVVVLVEPSTGSSIRKALLRVAGTLAGMAVGFAILYFVVLCNGLGHANHPQKFVLTSILLAASCGVSGAAAARTPSHTYMQITFCITVTAIALVGYTGEPVLWSQGLWRAALTGIGVGINFLAVTLVLPVTSREIIQSQFASILGQLGKAAEATVAEIAGGGASQRRQQGQQPQQQPDGGGEEETLGEQQKQAGQGREVGGQHTLQPADASAAAPAAAKREQGSGQQESSQPASPPSANGAQSWPMGTAANASHHIELQPEPPPQQQQQLGGGGADPDAALPAEHPRQAAPPAGPQADGLSSPFADLEAGPSPSSVGSSLPPGSPPGSPHASPRRLPLQQHPSLVVEPLDPATLSASSHKALRRALRQLAAPAGPSLLAASEHLLGAVYTRLLLRTWGLSASMSGVAQLIPTLRFEWHPFEHPHRLSEDAAFRAQRLCRHCLNVLSAFATSMDAHHISRVELLAQHRAQVCRVGCQLDECLQALRAMVQRQVLPQSTVGAISSLQAHLERLFLLVLLRDLHSAGGSVQGAQGAAFLAMLFSLGWAVRRLALALARTFWDKESAEVQAMAAELEDEQQWQLDERLLAAAQAVLGLAGDADRDSDGGRSEG